MKGEGNDVNLSKKLLPCLIDGGKNIYKVKARKS